MSVVPFAQSPICAPIERAVEVVAVGSGGAVTADPLQGRIELRTGRRRGYALALL